MERAGSEVQEPLILQVTDLKQYAYCPRVVYYRYCLPDCRPLTYKMEVGKTAHEEERARERRRFLRRYGLDSGDRYEDVVLVSAKWGLSGRVDLVIVHGEGEGRRAVPVDYKNGTRVGKNWKDQLTAYALMLETEWGVPVERGFIYLIPVRRAVEVKMSGRQRARVRRLVDEIRQMVQTERIPAPTSVRARCVDCEFRRFCNDVF